MSVPKHLSAGAGRVADYVVNTFRQMRHGLTPHEAALRPHLRGNEALYGALHDLITSRIEGRASIAPPSDPLLCYQAMARDHELRLLLSRLERVYRAPVMLQDDGELPAD